MRVMSLALMACVLVVLPSAAIAKEDPLDAAKALAKQADRREAAAAFATLFEKAAKKRDLLRQEEVADAMVSVLSRYSGTAQRGNERYIATLRVLFDELDTRSTQAWLCRPRMAAMMLMQATQAADAAHGAHAAAWLAKHAKQKGAGRQVAMLAKYAHALKHVTSGEVDKACPLLDQALGVCLDEQWSTMAFHVGTELAAQHVGAGRTADAAATVKRVADAVPASFDRGAAQYWQMLVSSRLKDAPAEVLAGYKAFADKHLGAGRVGAAGGAGGAGAPGGGGKSPVGKALETYSRKKPLVSVTRVKEGFEVRFGFDKAYEHLVKPKKGVHHHASHGVTLSFWGAGVRLHMVDPTGRNGQPGESSSPRHYEMFRDLGVGETWTVTRDGVVAIR